ncbi:unnamed protein product [Coccothraustes coccothraustes]
MFFRCLGPSSLHRLLRPQPRPALPRPLGPGGRSLLRAAAATGTSPRVCALPARIGPVRAGLANPGDDRGGEAVAPSAAGRTIRPRPADPEPPARAVPARVPAGLRPPPGREEATP